MARIITEANVESRQRLSSFIVIPLIVLSLWMIFAGEVSSGTKALRHTVGSRVLANNELKEIVQYFGREEEDEQVGNERLDSLLKQAVDVIPDIVDFEKQEGVVIAVCIFGQEHVSMLKQSLCLLKAAYPVHYDHLVFTTVPIPDEDVKELEQIVAPARITITNSTRPLEEELADLTPTQQADLCRRCNVTSTDQIKWNTWCQEEGSVFPPTMIKYRWQAEFRAKHLWSHPALDSYRYLMWLDADGMPAYKWKTDPIAIMMRNQVALFFINQAGWSSGEEFHTRTQRAFGKAACSVEVVDGHYEPTFLLQNSSYSCNKAVRKVHGFFHITDLKVYRSPDALRWYDSLVGDDKYNRVWDDQISVTMPGAMLAPNRSWDMHSNGFSPLILHNRFLDGKHDLGYYFRQYWGDNATTNFPEAIDMCNHLIKNDGRR